MAEFKIINETKQITAANDEWKIWKESHPNQTHPFRLSEREVMRSKLYRSSLFTIASQELVGLTLDNNNTYSRGHQQQIF